MILAFQLDPEVAEMNGADIRLGAQLANRISYEIRLIFLFMEIDDLIVMPPTYWLESDITVQVLLSHSALIEQGYIKFLMNEKTFEDFRQKKSHRYRKLMHITRFKAGYGVSRRDPLRGIATTVLSKNFSAGRDTFDTFRMIGSRVLRSVLSRQEDIDYFLEKLEHTQRDVFIWESMIEELKAADIDVGKAENAGLRAIMDETYYKTYAAAGFIIPSGSEINHLILTPDNWSQWCRLDKLRLVVRLLGLESWLHTTTDELLCEMKILPEWRHIAAQVRKLTAEGQRPEPLIEMLDGTSELELIGKEMQRMAKSSKGGSSPPEDEIIGSIAFFAVSELTLKDTRIMASTLQKLANTVRDASVDFPELLAFPTLSGYIALLPDKASQNFVDFVSRIYLECQKAGVDLNVGIHRGIVPLLHDIDGSITPISPEVNQCARLAYAKRDEISAPENSEISVIASVEFGDFAAQGGQVNSSDDKWLFPSERAKWSAKAKGKRNELFDILVAPKSRFTVDDSASVLVHTNEIEIIGGCLLIAYDLPKFSDGDQSRVDSRFFDVSRIVTQQLRRTSEHSEMLLSPGGDGGIIMISGMTLENAYNFANGIHEKLGVLDRLRTKDAGSAVRVGVHYSGIAVYTDANGVRRGIGTSLFVADALANDEKGRQEESVVYSNEFKKIASHGDNQLFEENFKQLDSIKTETGFVVDRFAKKAE